MNNRNWVSADGGGPGQIQTYQDPGPGVYVETAGAWVNVAPATREGTSAKDRAVGLVWRAVPLLLILGGVALAITTAASLLAGGLGFGWFVTTLLLLWGVSGLVAYLVMDRREWGHSSAGVERLRIETAGDVAIEQIRADREIRLETVRGYLSLMDRQQQQQQIGGPRD